MPTLAQLQAEPEWRYEFIPPNLRTLVLGLQAHYGLGWSHIGCKGDENHLRGYHRSRAWILGSAFCTNRTYSVSRTAGDRSGGDPNWLCAIDATLPRAELIAACHRLDAAVKAGRLEKVTEWYGNDDGDNRVDGYDNISNAVASSDDSHLWHLHMSFDRGRANEDHDDLYRILTGTEEDDMTPGQAWVLHVMNYRIDGIRGMRDPIVVPSREIGGQSFDGFSEPNMLAQAIKAIPTAAIPVDVDEAAIAAAVAEQLPGVGEIADAVNDDAAARLAD